MAGRSPTTSNVYRFMLTQKISTGWDMCANDNHPTWFPLPSTLFSAINLKYLFESLV